MVSNFKYITKNVLKDVLYDKTRIFFYINKKRALDDLHLIDNLSSGVFKQYSLDGSLTSILTIKNGKLNGICKNYSDGELDEEIEYKNNLRNGLCKKYIDGDTVIEFTLWKNGVLNK
jgi:antitoxin component YwqK of YwqJK toxin-antitoxin module